MDSDERFESDRRSGTKLAIGAGGIAIIALATIIVGPFFIYTFCRIEVPTRHMAVLIKKTGNDLDNAAEIAPSAEYKGIQREVLGEGRYWQNPWNWDWVVVRQPEVPEGKLGVRIRLHGDNLPYGEIIARDETQKGIIPAVLRAGRHAINARVEGSKDRYRDSYAEIIEIHDPVIVPAGFRGVVTNLSGPMPTEPNVLLVEAGTRGVQEETYSEGTKYVNPYTERIDLVDCRSQRFNLSTGGEMGFPSMDGFWVTLDGIIEFRIKPEQAAQVFVTYNDDTNDHGRDARIDEEIINKIILPNARSFCRLRGSDHSGKDFISGDTRIKFQEDFQAELEKTCESQGIEIIQALITRINPPQQIAKPVRERQIAMQQEQQYVKEIVQQESEKELAIEQELINQKKALIEAERDVIKVVTEAQRAKEVALIEANQQLAVAEFELKAAKDEAAAVMARGKAAAEVIQFDNEAEAAGWRKAVEAFSGNGNEYARWVLLQKMAPSFKQMMVNTADSPLMEIFQEYKEGTAQTATAGTTPNTVPTSTPVTN